MFGSTFPKGGKYIFKKELKEPLFGSTFFKGGLAFL
jgi:hypothetical protein